jgi:hypothetical protein
MGRPTKNTPFNEVAYKGIDVEPFDFRGYVGLSARGEWGRGTYWTTDIECAKNYGDFIVSASVNLNNPFYAIADYDDNLNFEIDYESASTLSVIELFGKEEGMRLIKYAQEYGPEGLFTDELEKKLKPLCHDGIVATWEGGSQHIIVWDRDKTECKQHIEK